MSEYCLRWNNHQPNLVTVFSELLNAESLVDVTLATDGHFIHAHKLVLSACSVYFKDLFGSNPCKHPIVFLKDIKIEDLKTVIDFIYRGEVNVSQERLQDVLKTAESLRIKGLADKPFSSDEYPSQNRGQHLSSSFSSQRSSLTDSREHAQSIDAEDGPEASGNSPPASKKRKVVSSQDSGDCPQDTNHDGEDKQHQSQQRGDSKDESPQQQQQLQHKKSMAITINDEGLTKSKDKVKEEKESMNTSTSESRPEYSESRAADAMLLLQGSSSEGGGEDGVATPITSSNSRSDSTSGLISPHSQSLPGRPTSATVLARMQAHRGGGGGPKIYRNGGGPRVHQSTSLGSTSTVAAATNPTRIGHNDGKKIVDPYLYANCLIVRPKLKASDGSYVTIRTGTAENFLRAVDDVRNGKMGFCKAGKVYGVNHATLQKFYKAMGYSVRNRSNNPNFLKTPPSSEREEENDGGDSSQQQVDVESIQYNSYPSPTAFYQHFLTPHSEHGRVAQFDFQRNEGVPSSGGAKNTEGSTNGGKSLRTSNGSSSTDAMNSGGRFDPYSSGRLLNYSSFYCEAINLEEEGQGSCRRPSVAQIPVSSSSSQQQNHQGNAAAQTDHNIDVNQPIVLCNL